MPFFNFQALFHLNSYTDINHNSFVCCFPPTNQSSNPYSIHNSKSFMLWKNINYYFKPNTQSDALNCVVTKMATEYKLSLLSQHFTFDSRLHRSLPCNVHIHVGSQNLLATATSLLYNQPFMLNGSMNESEPFITVLLVQL